VIPRLGEAKARIDHDPTWVHAGGHRGFYAGAKFRHKLGDNIVVVRVLLHVPGMASPVHQDDRNAGVGDHPQEIRIRQPARDVVDQVGPGPESRVGNLGAHRVHRDGDARGSKLTHNGHYSPELFLNRWALRTRAGRLPADVNDVGTLRGEPKTMIDRAFGVEPQSTVGKRVRSDVDDAHDQASRRPRKAGHVGGRAAGPVHNGHDSRLRVSARDAPRRPVGPRSCLVHPASGTTTFPRAAASAMSERWCPPLSLILARPS
jgi:hypothetical protein